jgi:hypothetical protein
MCGDCCPGSYAYQSLVFDCGGEASSAIGSEGDNLTMGDLSLESHDCWENDGWGDYRVYTGGQAFIHQGETLIATFANVTMGGDVDYSLQTIVGSGTAEVVEAGTHADYFAEYGSLVSFTTYSDSDPVIQDDCGYYNTVIVVTAFDGCTDAAACNTGEEGDCVYPDTNYDCDGNCISDVDCSGVCGGDAEIDECGLCGGDGSSCAVAVTFSVDMSVEGVVGDIKLRTSTVNGEYSPSDWYVMDDNGDGTYSYMLTLSTGVTYG